MMSRWALSIENEDGSWRTSPMTQLISASDPDVVSFGDSDVVFYGDGAYEGLVFVAHHDLEEPDFGLIIEGE